MTVSMVNGAMAVACRMARSTARQGHCSLDNDAEELESAACWGVALAARTWDPQKGSWQTWCLKKTKWAIDEARRDYGRLRSRDYRTFHENLISLDVSCGDVSLGDTVEDPEDREGAVEVRVAVRQAVGSLPPRERAIVTIRYLEGRSMREAARTLGLTKRAALKLHADALRLLREAMC